MCCDRSCDNETYHQCEAGAERCLHCDVCGCPPGDEYYVSQIAAALIQTSCARYEAVREMFIADLDYDVFCELQNQAFEKVM